MHLQQDITPADEFAVYKDLRDSRPVAEVLDSWNKEGNRSRSQVALIISHLRTLSQSLVLKDIEAVVLDAVHSHYLDYCVREAASWCLQDQRRYEIE